MAACKSNKPTDNWHFICAGSKVHDRQQYNTQHEMCYRITLIIHSNSQSQTVILLIFHSHAHVEFHRIKRHSGCVSMEFSRLFYCHQRLIRKFNFNWSVTILVLVCRRSLWSHHQFPPLKNQVHSNLCAMCIYNSIIHVIYLIHVCYMKYVKIVSNECYAIVKRTPEYVIMSMWLCWLYNEIAP